MDFTRGVGKKWKLFFEDLEFTAGLDADSDVHIWLLHHLFLTELNKEILEWAEAWNNHRISTPGLGSLSPKALKFRSLLQHGVRGIMDRIPEEEIQDYGIDWEDYDNTSLQSHHNQYNYTTRHEADPVIPEPPSAHTVVDVQEPNCPLDGTQLRSLQQYLSTISFVDRRDRWILALAFCRTLV